MIVYVSGPFTANLREGTRAAILAAEQLRAGGHLPFVPHLFIAWDTFSTHGYEYWMSMDLEWIARSDALLRLPGSSPGADREVARARELGIPVFESIDELFDRSAA